MEDCTPVSTAISANDHFKKAKKRHNTFQELQTKYPSIICSLIYTIPGSRPIIVFMVFMVSQYVSNTTEAHNNSIKEIFCLLKYLSYLQLVYRGNLKPLNE